MERVFNKYYIDSDCELVMFNSLEEKVNAVNNSTKKEISNMHLTEKESFDIKNYTSYHSKI